MSRKCKQRKEAEDGRRANEKCGNRKRRKDIEENERNVRDTGKAKRRRWKRRRGEGKGNREGTER